jgi:hypothetical protein
LEQENAVTLGSASIHGVRQDFFCDREEYKQGWPRFGEVGERLLYGMADLRMLDPEASLPSRASGHLRLKVSQKSWSWEGKELKLGISVTLTRGLMRTQT